METTHQQSRNVVTMHNAEVTFPDGHVDIVPIWKQAGRWVANHPKTRRSWYLNFVEEYEGVNCYDAESPCVNQL